MKLLTHQEIFDKVARHLLTQRRQAIDDEGNCEYRTATDLKCAAGCLFPDTEYDEAMEGRGVMTGVSEWADLFINAFLAGGVDLRQQDTVQLVTDLQDVHDMAGAKRPSVLAAEWADRLRFVARRFELNADVIAREFGL